MRLNRAKNPLLVWVYYLMHKEANYDMHYFWFVLNGRKEESSTAIWDYSHPEYYSRNPLAFLEEEPDWLEYYPAPF
jgi:hypothetical protein